MSSDPQTQQPQPSLQESRGNFIPYDQYRAQTMPQQPPAPQTYYSEPQPRAPFEEKRWWIYTKIAFQIASVIFSAVGIGLTVALSTGNNFFRDTVIVFTVSTLVVSLLWSVAELIVRGVRKVKEGIHPGAHVAMSLLIWLGTALTGGMLATLSAASRYYLDDYQDNCWVYEDGERVRCSRNGDDLRPILYACTAFHLLVFVVHFFLFVGACIDTAKRNAYAKTSYVYVQVPHAQNAWPQQQPYQYYGGQTYQMQPTQQSAEKNAPVQQQTYDMPAGHGVSEVRNAQQAPAQEPQVREFYGR